MMEEKTYCDTSKLSIRLITKSVAKDIIVNNHYSGLWTKVSYAIGLFTSDVEEHPFFDNVEDKLIGVACYGDPIGRSAGQSISPLLERTEVLELTRLFVFDDYGSNIESWFLGQTFNWLKENVPHIKGLISYSDPKEGHCGTIYQATNWLYTGATKPRTDIATVNGKHPRHHAGDRTKRVYRSAKHRYVFMHGNKKDKRLLTKCLRYGTEAYPKKETIQ